MPEFIWAVHQGHSWEQAISVAAEKRVKLCEQDGSTYMFPIITKVVGNWGCELQVTYHVKLARRKEEDDVGSQSFSTFLWGKSL